MQARVLLLSAGDTYVHHIILFMAFPSLWLKTRAGDSGLDHRNTKDITVQYFASIRFCYVLFTACSVFNLQVFKAQLFNATKNCTIGIN
jgi:hypothetical protein